MIAVGSLSNVPWESHKALGEFIKNLAKKGITARLVGGVVRDALLSRLVPSGDFDFAVDATPDQMIAICFETGLQVIPTGVSFGTVTCIIEGEPYEITSLRKDITSDGRKAVVQYTKDWSEDAQRRDLTINALYADWDGKYYDPTGMGIEDLNNRYLRFVGDPESRIKEDFLRIIRFFRFMALFPSAKYEEETYKLCIKFSKKLKSISLERKWGELKKIFKSDYPLNAIESLISSKIMSEVCRINWSLNKLERSLPWVKNRFNNIFYGLLGSVNQFSIDSNNCIPLKLQKRLEDVFKIKFSSSLDLQALYWFGKQNYKDAYIRDTITNKPFSEEALKKCNEAIEAIDAVLMPRFPVSGANLQELGFTPGPAMGDILRETEKWWVESNFTPDFEDCLQRIKQLYLGEPLDKI
ncbi:MAG: CCA tRNA nucleotidyltransferase [Candidatus Paracaedibacteraceae bacterium]|nr:CCA tRNA nucleotidyltransferase [Candidatus Paracaedibacteraceae bacterium]